MTQQPTWELLANLGDVHPIDHGGYFVYRDATGVYPEEGEKLISPDTDEGTWYIYRFSLERKEQLADGKIIPYGFSKRTDLPYPLEQYEEWFSDKIAFVASFVGQGEQELRDALCSKDPLTRARAYEAIGDYHGFENLDSYPLTFNSRTEVEERYTKKNAA